MGPGPKIIPLHYIINTYKGGSLLLCIFLMYYYNNYSLGAYIYTCLHGSYGLIWFFKEITFPDKSFRIR